MEKRKEKKLSFHEIGSGKFYNEAQDAFESAQLLVEERNLPSVVTLKIKISPSDEMGRFGQLQTSVGYTIPPKASAKITTELKNGIIISDGENIDGIIQETLKLEDRVVSINTKQSNGS